MSIIAVKRLLFFITSSIIIALLIRWGFDGFHIFTKVHSSDTLIDSITGKVYIKTPASFKLGLDFVLVISIAISGLALVIHSIIKYLMVQKQQKG